MAKEYIERGAVYQFMFDIPNPDGAGEIEVVSVDDLDAIPADVVPVVRCEKCKFWDREHISCEGLARCNTGETGIRYRKRSDFCSCGERKDGDGE